MVVMEAIQPSALNVADLRRQECRGDGEQGEYYLGESSLSSIAHTTERFEKTRRGPFCNFG